MNRIKVAVASALAAAVLVAPMLGARQAPVVTYEVYAIRFGVLPDFPVSDLVAGAERGRTLDIPVMLWLLKGSNGRTVLVDSGFYRQKFLDQWKPRDLRSPADAVKAAGVLPEQVTDIVNLYENLDTHAPIAQTLDAASNLKAQDRIRTLASKPRLIVPGHDPAVFERYARVADGIVRIQ